jgi:hypothetical protein
MGTAQQHIAAYCPTCQDTGKKQPKARCDLPVGGLSLVRPLDAKNKWPQLWGLSWGRWWSVVLGGTSTIKT